MERIRIVAVVGLLASVSVFLTGCGSGRSRNAVSSLMNAEITFPENLRTQVMGCDMAAAEWLSVPYKLVVYMNSVQCDGCRLKDLLVWKHYMRQIDSMGVADSVRFVFVFYPKDTAVLAEKLALYDFNRPVWLDLDGDFERQNPLPESPAFHTFLLNREDRIRLIGSPVGNSKMWKLYRETIREIAAGESNRRETDR